MTLKYLRLYISKRSKELFGLGYQKNPYKVLYVAFKWYIYIDHYVNHVLRDLNEWNIYVYKI